MTPIEGGFRLIFEREGALDIKITDPRILAMVGQDIGSKENVTFKILQKEGHWANSQEGGSGSEPEVVKVEISSDHDYFYFYRHM